MGRLIDADKLMEKLLDRHDIPFEMRNLLCGYITEQPTAYDVDAVVGQLEEKTELAYKRYNDCPSNSPCYMRYMTQYSERKMCLEIVKGGCVDV